MLHPHVPSDLQHGTSQIGMQSCVNTLQEVWVHGPASEAIVEHVPLLHDWLPQFVHVTPPVPHVVFDMPPTQLPLVSQQPPQWLDGPHTGVPASPSGPPSAGPTT
jgi:hypothetical protein